MASERVAFQGLPARICWLGLGERARMGARFNDMVAAGQVAAPIVIGRDHLDCGSVASPYRETESMADGSDAIADWPLLNAMVNVASGASWVSIHDGGGVGIGRSLHAGQVSVADGTALAAAKLDRVLTNDPAMGVIRHVDAGYDLARRVAAERGVRHTGAGSGVAARDRPRWSPPSGTRCCGEWASPSTPTSSSDPETQALIDDLIDTMRYYNGAGLAAPQVMASQRIVVIEVHVQPALPLQAGHPADGSGQPRDRAPERRDLRQQRRAACRYPASGA